MSIRNSVESAGRSIATATRRDSGGPATLAVRVLGELAVEVNGSPIPAPRTRRTPLLLGWLALHPGMHPRAEVAARLWPDVRDSSARDSLRMTLSALRRELGAGATALVTTRDAVGLAASPRAWVDRVEFDALVRAGRLEQALELCGGELLSGLGDDWVLEARDAHRDRVRAVLLRLAADADADRDLEAAVGLTRRAVELDPLDEAGQRELIRRLAAGGHRSAALAAYHKLCERLRSELALAPSQATRRLVSEIRAAAHAESTVIDEVVALPARLAIGPGAAFVGRESELARLRAMLARAAAGERLLTLLTGEPGIGKTRLASELGRVAHVQGWVVLYGRCDPEPLIAYQPFVEALEHYASALGDESRYALAATAPSLAHLLPALGDQRQQVAAAGADPEGERFRLFAAVNDLVMTGSRQAPMLLVLDDLHWADRSTLLLLAHLATAPEPARLVVFGVSRTTEVGPAHPLVSALADVRRDRAYERIELDALSEAAVAQLLAAWPDRATPAPPEVAEAIHARTGGNPFFIEQLVRDAGSLDSAAAVRAAGVPAGVREIVQRRVYALGDDVAVVLQVGAVAGPEFALADVTGSCGLGEERVLDALDAAVRRRLLAEVPGAPSRFVFAHALVRATLDDDLSAARRAHLHGRLADALEHRQTDGDQLTLGALARHCIAAGPARREQAFRYGERAARAALDALGYEEAADLYERLLALELQDAPLDPDRDDLLERALAAPALHHARRCELLLGLGDARARAGITAGADAAFEAAAQIARRAGDAGLFARAALGRGGLGVTIVGSDPKLVALLEDALATSDGYDADVRARLLTRLTIELSYAGEDERRVRLSNEAVAAGRASGDPGALAAALGARHVALWGPDDLTERLSVAAEMLDLAQRAGDRDTEALARNWRVCDLLELGDHAATVQQIDAFARLAEQLRVPRYRWYVPLWRASLATAAGDTNAGRELAQEANALGHLAGDANADLFLMLQLWTIGLVHRRMPRDVVERVEERAANSPVAFEWGFTLVLTYALADRFAEARRAAAALDAAAMRRLPKDTNWITVMCELSEALALLDDRQRARVAHGMLARYTERQATCGRGSSTYGSVAFFAARAAATAGERDEADRLFARAAAHNDELEAHAMSVQARWRHGELLLGQDPGRAHDLLSRAKADAERLGLAHVAVDIESTLDTRHP